MKRKNWLYSLLCMGFVFITFYSCKKDSNNEVSWNLGTASTYQISAGLPVTDSVTGFQFWVNSGSTAVTVSKIVSGPTAPFAGKGYKINYTGSVPLNASVKCTKGNRVLGLMYGCPDGLFNGTLTDDWIGMPDMGVSADSTQYYFTLPQPYNLSSYKTTGKKRGSDLFWFSEIQKASTETQKMVAIELQSRTFLEDAYINALNSPLKEAAIAARAAKPVHYAYGDRNNYEPFWKPLGYLAPYVYHPTINLKLDANSPSAEDIAHETSHFFINLVVGNEVQKTLSNQAGFFDNHGFNTVQGRDYVVEDFAYFTETVTESGYQIGQLNEPAQSFADEARSVVDYPSIEGFGATMMYSLVRTQATIKNVNNPSKRLDFPVVGLTYGQVFDIIAIGGTNNNQLKNNIENYLSLVGTPVQRSRFEVALQRIGWSYTVKGILLDSTTNKPLEGYTVQNIYKGSDGTEYSNGDDASAIVTGSDGAFRFNGSVFPGNSILRFSKNGISSDVTINCPSITPTNTEINLSSVKILTGSGTIAVGQPYQGGIIIYVDGTGKHGIIAAPSDQSKDAKWGCRGTMINNTAEAIGTGQANTSAIILGCSDAGIAALICDNLELNGYSDWYLPSILELKQMMLNSNFLNGLDGADYWSSTEYGADVAGAWTLPTSPTGRHDTKDGVGIHVRAVRSF